MLAFFDLLKFRLGLRVGPSRSPQALKELLNPEVCPLPDGGCLQVLHVGASFCRCLLVVAVWRLPFSGLVLLIVAENRVSHKWCIKRRGRVLQVIPCVSLKRKQDMQTSENKTGDQTRSVVPKGTGADELGGLLLVLRAIRDPPINS